MFNVLFTISLVTPILLAASIGARRALWIAWPAALLLLPVWMNLTMGALRLDLRTGAAVGCLIGFLVNPETPSPRKWLLPDSLMAALIAVQIVSERQVGQFGTFTIPEVLRQWLLPYLMGRMFLSSTADIARAVRPVSRLLLIVTAFAMFEAVTKFHPINKLLGRTYGLLEQGEGYRMGLKRSQAMTDHPIFFGMMMVLLLPWAIEAARRAKAGEGPKWWRLVPWLVGGALVGSVSRGPQLSAIFTAMTAFFFRNPKWRIVIIVGAVVGGTAAYGVKEVLLDEFQKVAGETEETTRIIIINGEEELYSGTMHRILLFKVYADAIDNAGMFGWGQQMRGIELEESIAERFGSIDSHYVMFFLQRGYSGVVPFVLLQLCTLAQLARAAWGAKGSRAGLAGSLFGAMLAVDIGFFSVWFSPDFGTVWLFNCGLSARLVSLAQDSAAAREEPSSESDEPPRFRAWGGAAPVRATSNSVPLSET